MAGTMLTVGSAVATPIVVAEAGGHLHHDLNPRSAGPRLRQLYARGTGRRAAGGGRRYHAVAVDARAVRARCPALSAPGSVPRLPGAKRYLRRNLRRVLTSQIAPRPRTPADNAGVLNTGDLITVGLRDNAGDLVPGVFTGAMPCLTHDRRRCRQVHRGQAKDRRHGNRVPGSCRGRGRSGWPGQRDEDLAVEPARSAQGWVEGVWPVGGGQHDHAVGRLEAVHLGQQLVEGLLALVVAD
jgi:hypothetical protein